MVTEEDYRSDWRQNLEIEQAARSEVFHKKEWKVSVHEWVLVYYVLIDDVECRRLANLDQY